jgi:hypothetical protein
MKTKIVYAFSDGGHGWAKVKRSELIKLNIENKITGFSYQRGEFVYLEEDCDLTTYVKALNASGIQVKFKETHSNKRSKIRSYDSFRKTKVELVTVNYL